MASTKKRTRTACGMLLTGLKTFFSAQHCPDRGRTNELECDGSALLVVQLNLSYTNIDDFATRYTVTLQRLRSDDDVLRHLHKRSYDGYWLHSAKQRQIGTGCNARHAGM